MITGNGIILVSSLGSGWCVEAIGEGQHLDDELKGYSLGIHTLGELPDEIVKVGRQSLQLRGMKRVRGGW